jgi:hypothetical protein
MGFLLGLGHSFLRSVLGLLRCHKEPESAIQDFKVTPAGCQWLTSVFLATQEAEIRRIKV